VKRLKDVMRDSPPTLRLRPYQMEAVAAVLREWEDGRRSTLLAMATGCGKTEVFLAVLQREQEAGRLGRALIIAHREELVDQPADRIARHFPGLGPVGIVQAGRNAPDAHVVIATVQTLSRRVRLDQVLRAGPITHLVIDEAHHAAAPSYVRLMEALREHAPALRVLGTTATPRGGSGARGLHRVFETVAYRFGIVEGIKAGALVPFRVFGVTLPVSFARVRIVAGDYEEREAGEVLSARNALDLIVKTWQKEAGTRSTLAFTASVHQAHALAGAFQEAGIETRAVDGTTPAEDRTSILRAFKDGEVRVLVNCAVYTEGVDLPDTACLVMARPTRSDSAYLQMAGRALRPAPGKTDALLLDFSPRGARDLVLAGDLLGKPREERDAEQRAREAGVVLASFAVFPDGRGVDAPPDALRLRLLDYLTRGPLAWTFDGALATAPIAGRTTLAAQVLPGGAYAVFRVHDWRPEPLGVAETWEDVQALATDLFDREGEPTLAMRRREWRGKKATEKQAALLRRWDAWRDGMTKGEAAQAITHEAARRTLRRTPLPLHQGARMQPADRHVTTREEER
jgi:superfamily II DNA or RNA helicase